jgi:hypothetical protein
MQSIEELATLLGAAEAEGQVLASVYWHERYPRIRDSDYRSPECRDGGSLDLRPQSSIWP